MKILTYEEGYTLGKDVIGSKAYTIARLNMLGIKVPCGKIILNDRLGFDNTRHLIEGLKSKSYAVRSSAVGEDSKVYSWAGCFDSYLDVKDYELEDKINLVLKSLFNVRAQAYRKLNPSAPIVSKMAIIVQEYILADSSGVLFTVNPINGDPQHIVVEKQDNSGGIVGGIGLPTTDIYARDDITDQIFKDNTELLLLKIGMQIEKEFGCPMDVEWLRKDHEIVITQARPITNL